MSQNYGLFSSEDAGDPVLALTVRAEHETDSRYEGTNKTESKPVQSPGKTPVIR